MPLIPLALILGAALLTAALGAHGLQQVQDAMAGRRQRREAEREAAEAASRAAAERAAAREAAAERARQEQVQAARAQQAEENERRRRHPDWYLTVKRAELAVREGQFDVEAGDPAAELDAARQELAAVPPSPPLARQLLAAVGVVFLALAFTLSAGQLVPSFGALDGRTGPSALDWLLGLIVAAIEVGISMMLAHYLRPERGWRLLSAKLAAAVAVTFALLVVVAQVEWAPAHDSVPLNAQVAALRDELAVNRQDHAQLDVIAADRNQISVARDELRRDTERDQGLALMVTLGADLSAWPALTALQYLLAARSRRRLRPLISACEREARTTGQRRAVLEQQFTWDVQTYLEGQGIDPAIAVSGDPARQIPPAPVNPEPGQPASPPPESAQPEHSTAGTPGPPGVTPTTLFPSQADNERWTDPL